MGFYSARTTALSMLLAACTSLALAQSPNVPSNGFRLFDVTTSVGYATGRNDFLPFQSRASGADWIGSGSASMGYTRMMRTSSFELTYMPTYVRTRNSGMRSLNQSLALTGSRIAGEKWRVSASLTAIETSLSQMLLLPTNLSQLANTPGSGQDLSGAVLGQDNSNAQLAALAGAGDTLSRGLVYGARSFGATAQISLSYNYSTRLRIGTYVGGAHYQSRPEEDETLGNRRNPLISRTSSGSGGVNVSYALTPRTQIGVDAGTTRVFGVFRDYYASQASASIGRQFTQRWFGSVHAGSGIVTFLGQQQHYPIKPSLTGGVSLGYAMRAHTFLAAYNRTVGDSYGFGANSTDQILGTWNWRMPAHRWGLTLGGGREQVRRPVDLVTWEASAGISYRLSRETSIALSGAYIDSAGLPGATRVNLAGWSARLSFVWTPDGRWGIAR